MTTEPIKHTPGPWTYCGCGKCGFVHSADAAIAQAFSENDHDLHSEGLPSVDIEVMVANARLIAAAPDLLDALHDTLAHFESIIARIEDGAKLYPADRAALDARFRQAHAAIAQATGAQQPAT